MVCAAGSLPGDLHKLWRARHPKNYHMEYGNSCMGYEIAGGLGIKMAAPERDVYVMVGDGSYLMLSQEIVTSIQEGYKLIVVLLDNQGFKSIGSLSRSLGQQGFGTRYVYPQDGGLPGDEAEEIAPLPVDLAANAASLGARLLRCRTYDDFVAALQGRAGRRHHHGDLYPERPHARRAGLRELVGCAGGRGQRDAGGAGGPRGVGADAGEGAAFPVADDGRWTTDDRRLFPLTPNPLPRRGEANVHLFPHEWETGGAQGWAGGDGDDEHHRHPWCRAGRRAGPRCAR